MDIRRWILDIGRIMKETKMSYYKVILLYSFEGITSADIRKGEEIG